MEQDLIQEYEKTIQKLHDKNLMYINRLQEVEQKLYETLELYSNEIMKTSEATDKYWRLKEDYIALREKCTQLEIELMKITAPADIDEESFFI